MKKKSNYRTPKRLLSLFLCVLMVATSVVFANPFTAEAVGNVNTSFDRWYSGTTSEDEGSSFRVNTRGATKVDFTTGVVSSVDDVKNASYTLYSSYDFRTGAPNKEVTVNLGDMNKWHYGYDYNGGHWWHETYYGSPTRTGEITKPATVNPGATSSQGTVAYSTVTFSAAAPGRYEYDRRTNCECTYSNQTNVNGITEYKTFEYNDGYSYYGPYTIPVNVVWYGINTTTLYNLYNQYAGMYGVRSYSDIFTGASWNNYLSAMSYAKSIFDGTIYSSSSQGVLTQTQVCTAETQLTNAVKNLEYLSMDISAALYSSGEGYGYSNRPDKVRYFSNLEFDVDLYTGYTQSVPTVTVNGKTYNGTKKDADTYHFVIPIETSIDSIVVNNVNKNKYTVTVPSSATGLTIKSPGSYTVTHGDKFSFSVEKNTGYTQKTPSVYYKIGSSSNWVSIGGVQSGNTYTYTYNGVTNDMSFRIDNQSVNSYDIIYKLGSGVSAEDSATKINHFGTATVKLTVDPAYSQRTPKPTVNNGTLSAATKNGNTYTYTLSGVTANTTVTVPALEKNTYTAVLPSGTGYATKTEDNLNKIVYGTSISFGVELEKQYDRSNVVVKYNGTVLEPTAGVYKIDNITSNITDGMITVEGVELNHYYITLPLETETGFTIVVGEGQNAKSVLSGTDFDFKFFLDPAYSDSNPVIKYSADGGDNYSVLTEKDGKYTIENVLSDCIVVVEGVKKNTYTVNFTQEDGTIIKQYKDVEYGAEVVFDGTEPTKASEKLDEYVEDGNNVVVTKEYKFVGWSADTTKVVSNMTVTPIFEVSEVKTTTPIGGGESTVVVTPKTANILFISGGVIVHKETIEKGKGFSGWDGTPVKTSSNPYETYTFTGWDTDRDGVVDVAAGESNAIADVQNDVTYTAVFESNLPSQTVEFRNFDGTELLYSASVKRGEKAEYGLSAIPSRTDNTNTYDFAGWAFETDADESKVVESFIVGENDVVFYAAYSRKPIVYSYKFVNDGVTLQEGTFFNGDRYKYLGSTPARASSVSTDYTFDGWDVAQSGYDTIYTATYSESVREYTSNLPTADGTYTITDNATIPYGDTFSFTVTVAEGYEETAPVVTSNGTAIEPASKSGNSYTYEIKLDGATAEEVYGDLTVTVGTTINNYDVAISGDAGCEVDPLAFNSAHGGEGSFIVTLKEGYTQTAPTINFEGDIAVTLDKAEGNVYTYKVTGIKSDAKITVETAINTYKVFMVNWNGEEVFSGMVEHGKAPVYTNPSKKTDKFGGYTFAGWDTDGDGDVDVTAIANVTGDITATAVYTCNHTHAEDPTGEGTAWLLVSTDKATCTEDGVRHYKCSYPGCTETKDWTIKARGHEMGEYTVTLAPTCTKEGSKIRYCVNGETDDYAKCNHSETAVVEKLGHAYGEWKTIVAPTCTEKGKAERVCANDPSHKEYKDIDATGHHDSDEDYICDDCGVDLGHCSKCICHKGNILSKVLRYICTLLTKTFHKPIKCCKDMDWYGDKISSIT